MQDSSYKKLNYGIVLVALLLATPCSARSPLSIRVIGGMTQAGSGAISYETDGLAPVFGLGLRYTVGARHGVFLDIERVQRRSSNTDSPLTRALVEPSYADADLTLYPITLGYQFSFARTEGRLLSPFISAGVCLTHATTSSQPDDRYPPLTPSSSEGYYQDAGSSAIWKFGMMGGVGCAGRVNSWLSISGTVLYRHTGLPSGGNYPTTGRADTQQNFNGVVFEGTAYDRNPSRPNDGGFEGRLVLEFRL
jgi:hypothetical protein